MKIKDSSYKGEKENKFAVADIVFMYLPIAIVIICAFVNQFPWGENAKKIGAIKFLSNTNNAVIIILFSYIITVGKNYFDLNKKVVSNIEKIRNTDVVTVITKLEGLKKTSYSRSIFGK